MLVREFDFDLPPELVAQVPAPDRGDARLLLLPRSTGAVTHGAISSLPDLLRPGDLLVVNDTRVFPARLLGRRVPSGGAVECLLVGRFGVGRISGMARIFPPSPSCQALTGEIGPKILPTPIPEVWEALMHPGQKLKPGARVVFEGSATLHGEVLERRYFGRRLIRLWTDDTSSVQQAVDMIGHVPLPPYIARSDLAIDRERYQTVFAREPGSVAAPTAGLHFSAALLDALGARGVETTRITLHVGYGTFQPVRVAHVEDHRLEPERYEIAHDAAVAVNQALDQGRRVVAVGTTTTRTLEGVAREHGGRLVAGGGWTDLFIYPGFEFRVIQGLLTNFHLPQSSLLMLVSALAGPERVLEAYRRAIAERYRFYSYGDAMLII